MICIGFMRFKALKRFIFGSEVRGSANVFLVEKPAFAIVSKIVSFFERRGYLSVGTLSYPGLPTGDLECLWTCRQNLLKSVPSIKSIKLDYLPMRGESVEALGVLAKGHRLAPVRQHLNIQFLMQ